MEETQFWKLIEESKSASLLRNGAVDEQKQGAELKRLLNQLETDEIHSFQEIFERKLLESYRWDLWGIAYVIHRGCSNSNFESFQDWLISQGKLVYENALVDPKTIAELVVPGYDLANDTLRFIASEIHKSRTGLEIQSSSRLKDKPFGTRWTDRDLLTMYPDACAKFGFTG